MGDETVLLPIQVVVGTQRLHTILSGQLRTTIKGSSENQIAVSSPEFPFDSPVPEDRDKYIRVGESYQAELPELVDRLKVQESSPQNARELPLWSPSSMADLTDDQMKAYLENGSTVAVKTSHNNIERALHALHLCQGDMMNAAAWMLTPDTGPHLAAGHPLLDYTYIESGEWSEAEVKRFTNAINLKKRRFLLISKCIRTKTVKECIQFYYTWKKQFMGKDTQDNPAQNKPQVQPIVLNPHNTRGKARKAAQAAELAAKVMDVCQPQDDGLCQPQNNSLPQPLCGSSSTDRVDEKLACEPSDGRVATDRTNTTQRVRFQHKEGSSAHKKSKKLVSNQRHRIATTHIQGQGSDKDQSTEALFPCALCERVFAKVLSRNAHLKCHKARTPS